LPPVTRMIARTTSGEGACAREHLLPQAVPRGHPRLKHTPDNARELTPDNSRNDTAETRQESSEGQGSGPDLAWLPPGSPLPGLTPAQRELRRRVLDAVSAASSKLAYGHALDHLFAFSAGRPLDRALLQEWKAGMEGLAPSTVNVRLSAVRKLVSEAWASGMLGVDEAARLTDVPNIRQQGTRLGNWLTREQARELLTVPDANSQPAGSFKAKGALKRCR